MILSESGSRDGPFVSARIDELATAGMGRVVETAFKTKNGGLLSLSVSVSVLRAHDGEKLGLVCVGRDLRDRKWAEEELRKANDDLEERVWERRSHRHVGEPQG